MEPLYTCKEIAERYGFKTSTVWEWIKSGKLNAFRIGKLYRIHKEALAEFEKSN